MSLSLPVRAATITAGALIASAGFAGTAFAGVHGNIHSELKWANCTGDTISSSVTVDGAVGSQVTARLLSGHDQGHLAYTGQSVDIAVVAGTSAYPVNFDIAGLTDRMYRVDLVDAAGARLATSRALPAEVCAPGNEVPEAPAALLIPLSLLGTVGFIAARKRSGVRA